MRTDCTGIGERFLRSSPPLLVILGVTAATFLLFGYPKLLAIPKRVTWPQPVRIEPASETLPANLLKFYLHFEKPMERGEVFRHLRLLEERDDGARPVVDPFREVELWDESFRRLTLWLHPGRQKPGVNLNAEMGPILVPGRSYVLEIAKGWRDADGSPLGQIVRHRFRTTDPDLRQPDFSGWMVEIDGRFPCFVPGEPLDPISLRGSLAVRKAGETEPLRTSLEKIEPPGKDSFPSYRIVNLSPDQGVFGRWPAGDYELVVDPQLEDLAGNSIARPFNLDLEKHPDFQERTEPAVIPFTVPEHR